METTAGEFAYSMAQLQLVPTPTVLHLQFSFEPDRGLVHLSFRIVDLVDDEQIAAGGGYFLPGDVDRVTRQISAEWMDAQRRVNDAGA